MADILQAASAGTAEKSDIIVEIQPCEQGIEIELESTVMNQFGASIEASIREVLEASGVKYAHVKATDRGALDCVIRARVETAVLRGKGEA